mgnify:CR=1 FL=1
MEIFLDLSSAIKEKGEDMVLSELLSNFSSDIHLYMKETNSLILHETLKLIDYQIFQTLHLMCNQEKSVCCLLFNNLISDVAEVFRKGRYSKFTESKFTAQDLKICDKIIYAFFQLKRYESFFFCYNDCNFPSFKI